MKSTVKSSSLARAQFYFTVGCALFLLVAFNYVNRTPVQVQALISAKDPTPPDPDRNSFDACGNEYDYQGRLISKGHGCVVKVSQPLPDVEGFTGK